MEAVVERAYLYSRRSAYQMDPVDCLYLILGEPRRAGC